MSFSSALEFFGEAAIVPGEPSVMKKVDCIYLPFSRTIFFDRDPSWGVYNLDGTIVSAAAYRRGSDLKLIGQQNLQEINNIQARVENGEYIYFGPLIPHYGHFLVTSLARAWFVSRPEHRRQRLLCHTDHAIEDHFRGYMGILTSALGLEQERFVDFKEPIRFTNLTIPSPAFIEQKLAYQAFLEPMQKIGEALLEDRSLEKNEKPAWVSKSRIGVNSVAHISNEAEIESILIDHGFDIIYPEMLPLSEQVELFSTRTHIFGFVGSAFHNHIFTQNCPRMTCITLDPYLNTNLVMFDRLKNMDVDYYYPIDNIEHIEVPGYATSRRIKNIHRFVADLLDAAQLQSSSPSRQRKKHNQGALSMQYDENCVPDHAGESYRLVLSRVHQDFSPATYLEIGTLNGETLALSQSASIAIDPKFQISTEVIGHKSMCLFFQKPSDDFFRDHDPAALIGKPIDFSFLDGMHRCEFLLRDFMNAERNASADGIIALHDCIPVEIPMTDRTQNGTPPVAPHRGGWWTGDVWRTLLALKRHRPDLKILSLDAAPTGLVLISRLDPSSTILTGRYDAIVEEMMAMDLEELTIAGFFREIDLVSTKEYEAPGALIAAMKHA